MPFEDKERCGTDSEQTPNLLEEAESIIELLKEGQYGLILSLKSAEIIKSLVKRVRKLEKNPINYRIVISKSTWQEEH